MFSFEYKSSCSSLWPVSHILAVHREVGRLAEVASGICFSAVIILNSSLQENNLLQLQSIGTSTKLLLCYLFQPMILLLQRERF